MINRKLKIKLNSKLIFGALGICILLIATNCDMDETQEVTTFDTLVLAQEFDVDGGIDTDIWTYDIGRGPLDDGWGNQELQYYTDRPENVIVEDGALKIIARQEQFQGANYTSGRIITKANGPNGFQQQYGRFEARIKLPWGRGLWPAFWLLGDDNNGLDVWPQRGEIDVMENRGQEPTVIAGSVHGPGYCGSSFLCEEEAVSKEYALENDRFDTGFHIFGIEWGENYINFYVDDVLYNQITPEDVPGEWVFNDEFYILLNVAVGGNYVGNPTPNTVFPQEMVVDYVRVYSPD